MNLIITDWCNRACPYCFAREKVGLSDGEAPAGFLSLSDLDYYIEFLLRSGIRDLKLLGGEPTLHPHFVRIVEAGLARKLRVIVFTNGLWPALVVDYISRCESQSLNFLFNVNEPRFETQGDTERQRINMGIAGKRGMLGFNVYRSDFDMGFMPDLINRFGLKRQVRVGIAHPIAGQTNACIPDQELPAVGELLLSWMDELARENIVLAMDCGFPLCMFPEQQLGKLVTRARPGRYSTCTPIIDVGPGLNAWPCFPLSSLFNVNLHDFEVADDLYAYYSRKLEPIRSMGFREECQECSLRPHGQCCCGCIARTVRSWEAAGDASLRSKLA